MVPLWVPHIAKDKFCSTWGMFLVMGAVWLSKRTPVRLNLTSAKFCAKVVLNYCSDEVLRLEWPYDPSLIPGSGLEQCQAHLTCLEEGL